MRVIDSLAIRRQQIVDFGNSAELKELSAYYSKPSIFSALGVSRHENTHNNFLAWLFDPASNHGLGDIPIRKFLECLALVCGSLPHSAGKMEPRDINLITSGSYTLSGLTVARERRTGTGRLDIYIEGAIDDRPFWVAVENKIKSDEHDIQTARYYEALKLTVSPSGLYLPVYLTPLTGHEYESLTEPQCASKEFIQLNYQRLADYVIAPCRELATDDRIKNYLGEYLLALGLPELRQDKGDMIMAISQEERDLLSRFWDRHKDLLIAAIASIGDFLPLEGEEQKRVSKASRALQDVVQRDLTRYTWENSGGGGVDLPKGRLVLEIVAHYAAGQTRQVSIADLKTAFPDMLQGGTFGVFAPIESAGSENFSGHKRYFTDTPINLADGQVAVCSQWKVDNLENFIDHAAKLGYSIAPSS